MLNVNDIEYKLLELYGVAEKLRSFQSVYIYGAGMVGRNIYAYLNEKGFNNKIRNFLVTEPNCENSFIDGKNVICIKDIEIKECDIIVLASKRNYRKQMLNTCLELNYKKVLEIDVFDDRTPEYYSALPEHAYPIELEAWYKKRTGEILNLDNPQTFNEKINWMKLYDRDPRKTSLADKYLVRNYVAQKIGENYLVPMLGVWEKFDDIMFDKLPDEFVLKCTHGSGWNQIVTDKTKMNYFDTKRKFDYWINTNFAYCEGLELHYKNIEPKIIAEKYLKDSSWNDIPDYKFFLFNGEVKLIQVDIDRFGRHRRNLYTPDWDYLPYSILYPTAPDIKIIKPENLDEMIAISEKLSEDFLHVRVDLYLTSGKIYFGELTFTHGSGVEKFTPDCFNTILGSYINLDHVKG